MSNSQQRPIPHDRRRAGRLRSPVAVLTAASAITGLAAILIVGVPVVAAGDHTHAGGSVHTHGPSGFQQFSGTAAAWPPRMVGARRVRQVTTRVRRPPAARLASLRPGRRARTAAQRRVMRVLGKRFHRVLTTTVANRRGTVRPGLRRTVYVSYSRNRSVSVTERRGRILALSAVPLARQQYGRTEAEQKVAVRMARKLLLSRGESRVGRLQGYAIMGNPSRGGPFSTIRTRHFPTRVLYVSFHVDRLAVPEYTAWVDLSRRLVLRAGPAGGAR
ncbi:MAG: hypothetical protein R2878_06330 [Thermoleophilia bacterium]